MRKDNFMHNTNPNYTKGCLQEHCDKNYYINLISFLPGIVTALMRVPLSAMRVM